MAVGKKKTRKRRAGRKVVQAKKVTVDGITFQSGLECTMYKLLKQAGIPAEYEPKSFEIFEPFKYSSSCWERARKTSPKMIDRRAVRKISYTPDFVDPDEGWIIECKGRANESFPLRWKIFKETMEQRVDPPHLFKPTNKMDCEQVIEELKNLGYGE